MENQVVKGEPNKTQKQEKPRKARSKSTVVSNTLSSKMNFMGNFSKNFQENPLTLIEAMMRRDTNKWIESMKVEIKNLTKNNTWKLVELPKNRKAVKSKWVFNIKRNKNGKVEKYKSRLVAKGCSQKAGIDYQETFSPVVRYASMRLILAISVEYDFIVHQMDVVSAYLNGELQDEIYMEQPEGFIDPDQPTKVCKLIKGIYGLKRSGREWNHKLDKILKSIGFIRSNHDSCVYTLKEESDFVLLAVFVDELLISGSSEKIVYQVKQQIAINIDVVDKGPVDYFLGMEIDVKSSKKQIQIHQSSLFKTYLKTTIW
jgi:hypothetical protein